MRDLKEEGGTLGRNLEQSKYTKIMNIRNNINITQHRDLESLHKTGSTGR